MPENGSPMIEPRAGTLDDIGDMVRIDALCFSKKVAYSREIFELLMSREGVESLVVQNAGDGLIAFALYEAVPCLGQLFGHLITIDVVPDHQKQRIGNLLLKTVHDFFKKRGLEKAILEVYIKNPVAIQFYSRLGYQVVSTLPDYYGSDKDGLLMMTNIER